MRTLDKKEINHKLDLLVESFKSVLYENDEQFLKNMEKKNLAGDDIRRYQFWEWTQGVGLYGIWKMYGLTGRKEYMEILTEYYDTRIAEGLPSKNINTVAPLLALSYLYEYTHNEAYLAVCKEWAEWIMTSLTRTKEGGFQHITSDSVNHNELWDDTLFMTVLFLANMGRILGRIDYQEEAQFQFLLHTKYLVERNTGLWYHGWTFDGQGHFAQALWGRGNCWVTIAIPAFLEMVELPTSVRRLLTGTLAAQIESLERFQNENGMWHTLIDDPTSYTEASATAGFAYGILRAVRQGLVPEKYRACAMKALSPILDLIDGKGIVRQVSYGTAMGRESKEFYKQIPIQPMPYGQAIAMLLLGEILDEDK